MSVTLATTESVFRAFAEPTRLRVLNLLAEGELCVCDLCAVLEVPQPSVSRHLACLRKAGLVTMRREGKWKHYKLGSASDRLHRSLLKCVRNCLQEIDELQDDLARLRQIRMTSCCD